MEVVWNKSVQKSDELILSGDIGGTNTNLALVGIRDGDMKVVAKYRFDSREVKQFADVVQDVFVDAEHHGVQNQVRRCCICAAGPVTQNRCDPTNLNWRVDGNELAKRFPMKFLVLNDFQALCYGIPLLDPANPEQLHQLASSNDTFPKADGGSWAIAGAGTGLGVGFLAKQADRFISFPSEGGHTGFHPFDEETECLKRYISDQYEISPGTEPFLSGRGMANIFNFYRDTQNMPIDGVLEEINSAADQDKPPLITRYTPTSAACQRIMRLFIRIYGRFASRVALFFLPSNGVYIAGGIVVRHAALFQKDHLFMKSFEQNYNAEVRKILRRTPVFMVKDYEISLLGAANAAVSMM